MKFNVPKIKPPIKIHLMIAQNIQDFLKKHASFVLYMKLYHDTLT